MTHRMGWNSVESAMIALYRISRYFMPQRGPYFIPQREGAAWVRILKPDSIDFEIPKSWLRLCREMHTQTCVAQNFPGAFHEIG